MVPAPPWMASAQVGLAGCAAALSLSGGWAAIRAAKMGRSRRSQRILGIGLRFMGRDCNPASLPPQQHHRLVVVLRHALGEAGDGGLDRLQDLLERMALVLPQELDEPLGA